MKKIIYISIIFLLVIAGCKKVEKVDTYLVSLGEVVITSGADNVSVSATYTYEYTLKSVKFMCSDNESLDNAMVGDAHFANGTVTATADGLRPNTTYFFKFEFYNGISRMWSEVRNFRTLEEPVVTELAVTTAEVTNVLETSAVCGGEVVSEGSSPVIARGVCYGLSENPTLENCIDTTLNGAGTGVFVSNIINLERETKYYVRAYATDSDTTCYGEQRSFETPMEIVYSLPTVITNNVDGQGVGQYNALLSGNVTDDGNMPITGCGFWYSTGHDTLGGFTKPTTYNTGGFSLNVTDGIEPGTTYFARAYAENEIGRRFGNEVSFTTLSLPPTPDPQVFTLPSSDVTTNSAKIKGRIYYDGTDNPIKKGFVYGLDVNDLNNDIDCTSQSDPFEAVLSGLTPNTTYYYKAYAQYAGYAQTFCGGVESFTTQIEITEPTIHTVNPSNITTTSANSGGYGITGGNSPIINKGVCWATFDNPTLESCNGHTENGSGTDDFTSIAAGLAPGTSYYVRAYAKNQAGKVGYGESLGFVTMIMHQAPDVTTNPASGISGSGATLGGSVTNNYNSDITECWIMWGEGDDAMTNRLDCNAGMTFSGILTNLQNNHMYSFKAFAKNEYDETGSGDIQHFTTNNEIPDVETLDATAITANSATMNGRVNDDHGINITECWIMWGRNASSMSNRLSCTAGADFSATVDTLQPNTTYYFTAYAKNANGQEGNGAVKQLHTSPTIPTVITSDITNIAQTTATGGGNVTSDGGATVTARGICWSTLPNPTISDSHTTDGSGTGIFTSSMTGLTPNTTYYVKAYATNSAGTAYGEPLGFVTMIMHQAPDVVTNTASGISGSGATLGGSVTNNYNSNITECWIMWGDGDDAMTNRLDCNAGMTFSGTVTGLQNNYTYSFQAFAKNEFNETGSGDIQHFTTNNEIPDVETLDATAITANSATMNGRVNDDHGINITECWVMWGRSASSMNNRLSCTAGADFSATVDTLQPNTTYYFTAYAKNANGQEGNGTVKQLLTSPTTPTVITSDITNIAQTAATGGGNVTSDGGATVTARGICWSTLPNPTISDSHTTDGSGTGTFTSSMTGLTPNTTYYVKAYATNSAGTAYGEPLGFVTMIMHQAPDVVTNTASGISGSGATLGGSVTNNYNSNITECWIMWGDGDDAMTNRLDCNAGMTFSGIVTGLQNNYTYSFQAFAKNEFNETGSGDIQHFTTNNEIPDVETLDATAITANSATMNGRVSDNHGININECWIMWGRSASSMNNRLNCTAGANFSGSVDTLQPNTNYYFMAHAKNANGQEGNGTVKQLLTSPTTPTVITSDITNIAQTTATSGGNVTNDGGANVTERGICWGTSQNPTTNGTHSSNGSGTGSFTVQMSGLTSNTTYYVRAYAVNSAGTSYGNEVSFTTLVDLPVVTTNTVSNITQTTATGGGNVTSGVNVTERGICWSTTQNPTTSGTHVSSGTGTGSFTADMTGLTPNTTYYVKAYATNSAGTNYGEQKTFTTTQGVTGNYFCISALDAGTTTVSMTKEGDAPTVYLEYKVNNGSWTTFTVGNTTINLSQNDSVFFKAPNEHTNNRFAYNAVYNYFVIQGGNVNLSGNIMFLLDPTGTKTTLNSSNNYAFVCLFKNCGKIVSASQLLLPATTLAQDCYSKMFRGCSSLTTAPELPATTLANSCYLWMFNGCTSLTTPPVLTATTLALSCYSVMFDGCTSLTTAPDLPATTLVENCYSRMFKDCTSLTTAPELPATTLANSCYSGMFNGCTSLTTAPELPATTLANSRYSYSEMFSGCTSLTTAPELPATTLAYYCYSQMFFDCISLTTAPNLPATTLADHCYFNMFRGCTSLTTAPELPATTLADGCYSWMFFDCISLTTAPNLPATTLADNCYNCMFWNCTSLTTAPNLPATTLADHCYSCMFDGCVSLTEAPILPAITLVDNCYRRMFQGCSNIHYIKMLATENLNAEAALEDWVKWVPSTGDFYKKASANLPNGINGIPYGWTVHNE